MSTVIKKPQRRDVFVADFIDVVPKEEIGSMEHPIFALTKRADLEVFRYHNKKSGVWIEVAPSLFGRANIFDKDLLLYCTGQLVKGMNAGVRPQRKVRITAYDYLVTTDRGTSGRDYQRLPKRIPYNIALEMLYLGRRMPVAEAAQYGLVNKVVPADNLLDAAREWATRLSKVAPLALESIKEVLRAIECEPVEKAFHKMRYDDLPTYKAMLSSEDAGEGVQAFVEKRAAKFKGK